MLTALALTVVIEAALAFAFGVRTKYGQLVVLLTNVITNPLLNAVMTVVSFYIPPTVYYWFLVPLELLVVLAEGRIYRSMLQIKMNPYLLSFLLNLGSWLIGTGILRIIK